MSFPSSLFILFSEKGILRPTVRSPFPLLPAVADRSIKASVTQALLLPVPKTKELPDAEGHAEGKPRKLTVGKASYLASPRYPAAPAMRETAPKDEGVFPFFFPPPPFFAAVFLVSALPPPLPPVAHTK